MDQLEAFLDDPQASANHLVLGMSLEQRQEARGQDTGNHVPTLATLNRSLTYTGEEKGGLDPYGGD